MGVNVGTGVAVEVAVAVGVEVKVGCGVKVGVMIVEVNRDNVQDCKDSITTDKSKSSLFMEKTIPGERGGVKAKSLINPGPQQPIFICSLNEKGRGMAFFLRDR